MIIDEIKNKNVLELGANIGDITDQILEMSPSMIFANEIDNDFIDILKKRFSLVPNIKICKFDLFLIDQYPKETINTIIIKEIINAFESTEYEKILKEPVNKLSQGGSIVIIDYLPGIHFRQLIFSCLRQPFYIFTHFKRYYYNLKFKPQLNFEKLKFMFPVDEFNVSFLSNVDPLNKYDSKLHKLIEKLYPMKYLFIAKKNIKN